MDGWMAGRQSGTLNADGCPLQCFARGHLHQWPPQRTRDEAKTHEMQGSVRLSAFLRSFGPACGFDSCLLIIYAETTRNDLDAWAARSLAAAAAAAAAQHDRRTEGRSDGRGRHALQVTAATPLQSPCHVSCTFNVDGYS